MYIVYIIRSEGKRINSNHSRERLINYASLAEDRTSFVLRRREKRAAFTHHISRKSLRMIVMNNSDNRLISSSNGTS